jgi:hypothetical protein
MGETYSVLTRENEAMGQYGQQAKILSDQQGGGHIAFNDATEATLKDAYNSGSTIAATADHIVGGLIKMEAWNDGLGGAINHAVALGVSSGKAAEDMQLAAINLHNAALITDELKRQLASMNKPLNAVEGDVDPNKKKKKDLAGSASMTVNGNINFTISSNQAPDQIAREVEKRIIDKRRFRTSSPGTRNFSVLPSGS